MQIPCDSELLICIAQTYADDVRFVNYFDGYAAGFALFLRDAIIRFIDEAGAE